MFLNIFRQEISYWLTKPMTYIFMVVFCAFTFLSFAGSAGLFDPPSTDDKVQELLNSYYGINFIFQYLTKLMVLLLPSIVGATLHRDFRYRAHSVLFTYPVNKVHYLLARLLASFSIVILIVLSAIVAMIATELLPDLESNRIGPFQWQAYGQVLMYFMIPNLFLIGILVMITTLYSRNIYAAFVVSLVPFLLQIISENAFSNNSELLALFDPFGQNSLLYYTHNWSLVERNQLILPVNGWVLYNRLLWLGISVALGAISIYNFKLHEHSPLQTIGLLRKKRKISRSKTYQSKFKIAEIRLTSSLTHHWKSIWHLSSQGFWFVVKSPIFIGITILAVLALIFAVNRVTQSGDLIIMPLTKVVLLVPTAFYTIICLMLIFVYSGLLIHREKNSRMQQLTDATATPFWVFWSGKFLSMVKIEVFLMIVFMVTGIILQTIQGYYDYEIALYSYHLLFFTLAPLIIWTSAAFFVHVLVDNLYVGLFVLVFGWVGLGGFPQIGITSHLILFNTPPQLHYSDLNGYGTSSSAFLAVESYWFCFGALLMILVHLFWATGISFSLEQRFKKTKSRWSRSAVIASALITQLMITLGSVIYQGESQQSDWSDQQQQAYFKQFQSKFEKYKDTLTPKIRTVDARVEIFPEENRFFAEGSYLIENPWGIPLKTLLIRTGFDEISSWDLSVPHRVVAKDTIMQFTVIHLDKPLEGGANLKLHFEIKNKPNTLFERNSNILCNGTFVKHDIFPRLGYTFSLESKHPSDSSIKWQHYQALDSDLIDLNLTVGTNSEQQVLAPGELMQQWRADGRNYFVYQTAEPIKFSFGINSGNYQVSKRKSAGKSLEIYSHHQTNQATIFDGVVGALNYQEQFFGEYGHSNVRIIEFPDSEGSYATAFANNIPMSEIRFISNPDKSSQKTDLSFYVPAHELIHHWWGNKLLPASAKGAVMLTESITEYLSLKVYEQHFGKEAAFQFLKLQHQRYWNGHNKTTEPEPPLYLVEPPQQYISYGKGAVVMNMLSKLLGTANFNQVLASFMKQYATTKPPYPTSVDFLKHLESNVPDSLWQFVEGQFTQVSYFNFEMAEVTAVPPQDGELYRIGINLEANKWQIDPLDSQKQLREVTPNDWVEVGFLDEEGTLKSSKWLQVIGLTNRQEWQMSWLPTKVVVDPHYLLLQKSRDKNEKRLSP